MANRVLLNATGLKVSQAGVNVLTAAQSQLLFSSDWSALGLVQSGSYNVNSWSGSANLRSHSGSIALNKTHSAPPFMLFYWVYSGSNVPIGMGSGALFGIIRGGAVGFDSVMASFVASTTSIAVRAYYDKQATPSLAVPNMTFRYFIFDYGA